jgi:hypothetical protein
MTLHLSLPGAHRSSQQQEELREARRVLKEKIRNDWEYPTLPDCRSSGAERSKTTEHGQDDEEDKIAGFRFHAPSNGAHANKAGGHVLGLDFDPSEWREREEASETEGESSSISSSSKRVSGRDSTYKFEGPDSVAAQLAERRSARKRKRHEALQEEMQWNRGLELWISRRNEWCCARPATAVRFQERKSAEQVADTSSTASSSPRSSTSSTAQTLSTPATSPSATPDAMIVVRSPPVLLPEVLIPIAPSLLPNHPIRRRISTNMYPEIYSKIILQSRTPSVPINLSTLVSALVQGWKDDGEWPPKSGPVEPSVGRKKGSEGGIIRHGIKRVLRVTGVVDSGRKDVGRRGGEG